MLLEQTGSVRTMLHANAGKNLGKANNKRLQTYEQYSIIHPKGLPPLQSQLLPKFVKGHKCSMLSIKLEF